MITHDLGVVAEITHDIAVMYAGRVVERAPTAQLFAAPQHPYTWGLLRSIPRLDTPRDEELVPIEGRPPSLINRPAGCAFHPRCPYVRDAHKRVDPALEPVAGIRGHEVACLLAPQTRAASCGGGSRPATIRSAPGPPSRWETPQNERQHRRGPRPRQGVPDHRELPRAAAPARRRARRRRHHVRRASAARRSASWASPAAASRPPRGCCCGCSSRRRARSRSTARRSRRSRRGEIKPLRREMQMIFQDPYSSLNPRRTVGTIISEPFAHPRDPQGRGRAQAGGPGPDGHASA